MKKKKLYLCLGLVISLIIATSPFPSYTQVKAATHTHTADCFEAKTHTHIGDKRVCAGCYQGSQYVDGTCGGALRVLNTSTFTPSGAPSSVLVTVVNYQCQTCGYQGSVGGSAGSNISLPSGGCPATKYAYSLSCGYAEGEILSLAEHIHNGNETTAGTCYTANTTPCTGRIYSYGGSYNQGTQTCPTCGGNMGSYGGVGCTGGCGYGGGGSGHTCNGAYQDPETGEITYPNQNTGDATDIFSIFNIFKPRVASAASYGTSDGDICGRPKPDGTYRLTCDKGGKWYYEDGTEAIAVCDKVVTSIKQR